MIAFYARFGCPCQLDGSGINLFASQNGSHDPIVPDFHSGFIGCGTSIIAEYRNDSEAMLAVHQIIQDKTVARDKADFFFAGLDPHCFLGFS